jgi:hypothetical protein
VLEDAEQQVGELKELLKVPTPENFEAAHQKLTGVFHALQRFESEPSAVQNLTASDTAFLSRLPSEMTQVLGLFKGPVDFLQGLALFRIQQFGSYSRDGELRGLSQESSTHTITHL